MPSGSDASFGGALFRHVSPDHTGLGEPALAGSRRAARTGIDPDELLPRILLVVRAELQRVLDLTDSEVRSDWGLSETDLRSDDHRPCQEVARAARRAGYEAILFPSAADKDGYNLAVFRDRLRPGSSLAVTETTPIPLED